MTGSADTAPLPQTPDALDTQGRRQGPWTDPDPHGGVMVGDYVDGRREGTWRHYAADGRLRSEGPFRDGELDGDWTWYRANGELMQRGGFRRGRKSGVWERWTAAGRRLDSGAYDGDRKVGDWQTFHPDGTVKAVRHHKPAAGQAAPENPAG
ncbi:MORN repeat variant [Arthrobacter saudimassiliensis]|uniref:MORN repeat variant n=1 Tax=Arthrobacter saudimassiliensis TaxID=1461584 RepID=A0A078MNA6_9MICC|nr:MORN repeat variant [Arthrobacter saudimassiliensis]